MGQCIEVSYVQPVLPQCCPSLLRCFRSAERLSKRDVRAEWLLALAEVVKSVERATGCLEGAAVDCLGMGK